MIGCYQFFYDSASCMFSSEYFLGFSLRSKIMFYPAILRKNECRNRNISCFLYLGYFVGNRIYFRISTHPEIMNFCRALIGKPDTFRNGKVSSRFQIVQSRYYKWLLPTRSSPKSPFQKKGHPSNRLCLSPYSGDSVSRHSC